MELPVLGQAPAEEPRAPILGIDLGTTNSLVAVFQHGAPRVLTGEDGSTSIPSVVSFPRDGAPLVGAAARERARIDPARTIHSAKRLVGRGVKDLGAQAATLPYRVVDAEDREMVLIDLGDRKVSPQEVSAQVLLECRRRAAVALKLEPAELTRAVVTVPAYFDDAQRQATRRAAKLAGLDVMRIVNEPTAAALAYGLDRKGAQRVVVYDLGGGTFDVSVLELEDGVFRVLSTAGDTGLGGDDFDRAILVHAAARIREAHGVDVLADPGARTAMRMAAERTKIALSTAESAEFRYHDAEAGIAWREDIDWRQFQQWIAPLVQRTLDLSAGALADAGMKPEDVDEIVLVGGSTRVPLVKAAVAGLFSRPAHDEIDPDQVVALGAAVQAGVLGGQVRDALLLDVTPLSLGIETAEGAVSKLIQRNAAIPAESTEGFTTFVEGQTAVKFNVVQGERELAKDNRSLGEFTLRGIPPMAAGLPRIGVRFRLDADGVLRVKAKEERSGTEAEIEVRPKHGLTDEEVERMLADAWSHAEEDMVERQRVDLRSRIEVVLGAVRRHLDTAHERLEPAALERLQEAVEDAADAGAVAEPARLKGLLDELEDAAYPLAERLMEAVASDAVKDRKVEELLPPTENQR